MGTTTWWHACRYGRLLTGLHDYCSLMLISGFLVTFGVKEQRVEDEESTKTSYTKKEVLQHIFSKPMLIMVIVISMFIQIAHFSVQPIFGTLCE